MSDASSSTPAAPLPPEPPQPALPVAGWYPDAEVAGGQRWWDGQVWTEHRQPPTPPAQLVATQPYGPSAVQPYAPAALQPYGSPSPGYAGPESEPPLWAPWYGISFGNAVRRGWKKYATFDGRASLSEYWWWALASAIFSFGAYVLLLISYGVTAAIGSPGVILVVLVTVAYFGFAIALFIPSVAIAVRRLHDANYSGALYLLVFVPFGSIVLFVFTLMPSNPAGARYDRPQ